MSYDPFGIQGGSRTTTATPTAPTAKKSYYDPFKIGSVQAAPNPDKPQKTLTKAVATTTQAPKKNILSKAKDFVVDNVVKPTITTAEKSANTVAAGLGSVAGLGVAAAQAGTGHTAAAKKTVAATNKNADAVLNGGFGGKGGFITSKQANSSGGGKKGFKENFVKPVAKGVAEVAPLVVPAGNVAKGAGLLTKVVRGAVDNAAVGAGTTALSTTADGKFDAKETAKSAAAGAVLGGVFPVAGKAISKLKPGTKEVKSSRPNDELQTAIEEAHNSGNTELAKKLESQLPDQAMNPDAPAMATERRAELIKKMQGDTPPSSIIENQKAVDALEPDRAPTPQPGDVIKPTKVQVDEYINKANIEHPVFQQTMGGVAKDLGLKYTAGPVKNADRALEKVMGDYNGNVNRLKDSVRGTIEVPDHSAAGFNKVINKIKEQYPDATVKDGYKNYKQGYVDMKVTVKTPNGHTAEIILATPEMLEAKNKLGGHELYEIARDPNKTPQEKKAAAEQMHLLYNNAHDAANKRLASSSEKPSSLTSEAKASASETSSAPSRTTPTSTDLPEATTVSRSKPSGNDRTDSTTSSGVKNNLRDSSIPSTVAEKSTEVKSKVPHTAGNSRVYERLQAEYPELDGKVTYTPVKLKEEADRAVELIKTDKQKAYRIAMGAEVSDEITSAATSIALYEKALADGNHALFGQLVKNLSLRSTRFGQEISALRGSVTDNSTSRYVKELIASRLSKLGKNHLNGLKLEKSNGMAVIDKEVAKAQARLKAKSIDIKDAQSILDRITC